MFVKVNVKALLPGVPAGDWGVGPEPGGPPLCEWTSLSQPKPRANKKTERRLTCSLFPGGETLIFLIFRHYNSRFSGLGL